MVESQLDSHGAEATLGRFRGRTGVGCGLLGALPACKKSVRRRSATVQRGIGGVISMGALSFLFSNGCGTHPSLFASPSPLTYVHFRGLTGRYDYSTRLGVRIWTACLGPDCHIVQSNQAHLLCQLTGGRRIYLTLGSRPRTPR